MRVQLLEAYEYLVPHEAGDVIEVSAKVAERWFDLGIAQPAPSDEELRAEQERKAAAELEERQKAETEAAEAEPEGAAELP